jgi:sarcosine oxidase
MAKTFDVIVIGVGAMGAAACWQLARRGVRVLGLEQFSLVHALGSSHGHTRMIRLAYYEHPDYVPLLRRAYELWDELEAESGEKILYRTGGVYMGPPTGHVVSGALQAARQHNLAHATLTRADLADQYPHFALPDNFTAIHEPQAGFVLCEKSIAHFTRLALQSGATLHAHEPVLHIDLRSNTITTSLDTYQAAKILFCGGPWSARLLADLHLNLVITRQTLGWLWPQDPRTFELGRFPVWGIEQPDGSLAYGFPMLTDFPGLKLARHAPGTPADPNTVDRTPTESDRAEILDIASRYLPSVAGPILSLRTCLYTNSPDGHFIIDRHPAAGRAFIACGCSGHGFKFAPVIGQILADLATTGQTPLPIGFLGLGRFATSQ